MGDYNLFVFDGNDPEERMQLLMWAREATPERATFRAGERVGGRAGAEGSPRGAHRFNRRES